MFGLEELGLLGLFIGTFLAATVLPFSSDALYVGVLLTGLPPAAVLLTGTLGNWLGGVTTYFLGRLAKWEWVERVFRVKPETIEKQHRFLEKYGVWAALLTWVPFVGDVVALTLGFYKCPAVWSLLLMLAGKFGRFAIWTMLVA
ncbi:MAG: DedA family protein [Bacteroidales bacterium]|nr:DedA family protein [Bacteroidales bacterium]